MIKINDKRSYNIIIGSQAFFSENLPNIDDSEYDDFLELVSLSDKARVLGKNYNHKADILIIKNNNYHGITDTAHDRIGALIEELTAYDAEIYLHNPPRTLKEYLKSQYSQNKVKIKEIKQEYGIQRNQKTFAKKMIGISNNIIGQNKAIEEISKSMWYLTMTNREKPYVIMLYGGSSLGKTELVREIARSFFDNCYLEKHLSMFKNNIYSDYFFGEKPNRKSLGYDLLDRDSNLLFFDELDKCPEYFFSAFYTLFDNTFFNDATYDVDISGVLIVLTSNYQSEDEIKLKLGLPIYYRIDKFIHFENFSGETIYSITLNEIESRYDEYKDLFTPEMIYAEVSPLISAVGENARTIKYKVQKVIEELLFQEIKDSILELPTHTIK